MNTLTEMLQGLLELLQWEQESVKKLLEFSRQKQVCLIAGRDNEIPDLLKLEGAIVVEISEKEQQRKEQVRDIAGMVGCSTDEASFREIIAAVQDAEWKKKMNDARESLAKLVDQVKAENQRVNALLRQKLKYADMMLDLLLVPDTMINVSYDMKGKRETEDMVRSGFLDVYI
jgi:hypothetical protein